MYYSQGRLLHLGEWIMFRTMNKIYKEGSQAFLLPDTAPHTTAWGFPAEHSIPGSSVDGRKDLENGDHKDMSESPREPFHKHRGPFLEPLEILEPSPWTLGNAPQLIHYPPGLQPTATELWSFVVEFTLHVGWPSSTSEECLARLSSASGSTDICPREGRI